MPEGEEEKEEEKEEGEGEKGDDDETAAAAAAIEEEVVVDAAAADEAPLPTRRDGIEIILSFFDADERNAAEASAARRAALKIMRLCRKVVSQLKGKIHEREKHKRAMDVGLFFCLPQYFFFFFFWFLTRKRVLFFSSSLLLSSSSLFPPFLSL